MPSLEPNFNSNEYQLILSSSQDWVGQGNTAPTIIGDGNYIRMSIFNDNNKFVASYFSGSNQTNHFQTYYGTTDTAEEYNIYVSPNEALNNSYSYIGERIPDGNYRIKYDFLNNPFTDKIFMIDQISPSRKEVRLITRNINNEIFSMEENPEWIVYFK